MARAEVSETIDGVTFYALPLGYLAQRALLVRLFKCLGPALTEVLAGAPSLESLKARMLGPGLFGLVEQLARDVSDADLEWATDQLCGSGGAHMRYSLNGDQRPKLDAAARGELFDCRLDLYFRWIAFALGANFGPYFRALEQAGAAKAAQEAKAPAP